MVTGIPSRTTATAGSALQASTWDLSFRLMHENVLPSDALKAGHGLQQHPCMIGDLFYAASPSEAPDWADFLESGAAGIKTNLHGQHSSAVLLLHAGPAGAQRLFAICFGQGHHAIEEDFMQRQFGLRVTLNSISRKHLRALDSASLDTTVIQRRTQASRESDLSDFGLDTHRELLRLASGRPGDSSLAKAMSGKDALQIRKKLAFADLPAVCETLLERYKAKDYLKDYKFIDQYKPVYKGGVLSQLENLLFNELSNLVNGIDSDLHLAIPDLLPTGKASKLSYYGAHLPSKKSHFEELCIDDYVAELKAGSFGSITNIDDIRAAHLVRSHSKEPDAPFGSKRVYDCMVFEAAIGSEHYVLFDGQWYEVSTEFREEIEDAYLRLLKPAFLAMSPAANERELISELCTAAYPDLLCIDQTKLNPTGVTGADLEACDFLSKSSQLIHLKHSEKSSPLSHLWNQGLVSAEALRRDSGFRAGFRQVTAQRERSHARSGFVAQLPTRANITPSNYTIIYGVLKPRLKRSKEMSLPFFSKVALRAAADRLIMMGFNVELHLIEQQ